MWTGSSRSFHKGGEPMSEGILISSDSVESAEAASDHDAI